MAKYTSKSIEAFKLSEENFEDVVEWCGATEYDAEAFTLVLGDTIASIGDYVVQDPDGFFYILSPDEMAHYWETQGSLATPDTVSPTTESIIKVTSNVQSIADATSDVTISGGYFKASVATVDQPHVQIVGLLARAAMAKNCIDAYGIQTHLTLGAEGESIGNMTAMSAKTILGKNNAGGIVTAGLFTVEGAFTPNAGYGVWIDTVDATLTAGLEINANGGTLAAGIKLDKMGTGAITKDLVLQNGETIDNNTNGLVNVTGDIGVNGVKVVGAQVAALGLDAKSDTAKITDIIAALRAHGLLGPDA